MVNPNGYSRPEKAAEMAALRRVRKRMEAATEREGICCICKHRSAEGTLWGRSVCRIGDARQHPACEKDGKGLRFEFDATTMVRFQDRGEA